MARQTASDSRQAYLVEHYRPGLSAQGLRRWAARARAAVDELEREGKPVRFVRSTIVPTDELLLCIVESKCEELVREAYRRAGIPFERISAAVSEGD